MAFFVGQKVTKIDDAPWQRGFGDEINPEFGAVYTIREMIEGAYDGTCLRFVEIANRPHCYLDGNIETAWPAACFRPVTDISDLIQIANEVKSGKPRTIGTDEFDAPRKKVRAK